VKVTLLDPSKYTPAYNYSLCNELANLGVEVVLLTTNFLHAEEIPNKKYVEKLFYYRLTNKLFRNQRSRFRGIFKIVEHVLGMFQLVMYLKRTSVKVLHVQWLPVAAIDVLFLKLIKYHTRVKVVYTAHNALPHDTKLSYAKLYKRIYDLVDDIIVHTDKTKTTLVKKMDVNESKVHLIKHGNFNYLNQYAVHPISELEYLKNKDVIISFGILRPYKGIDVLISALSKATLKNPGIHLLIVGRIDIDKTQLYTQISNLGIKDSVTFVDRYIDDSEISSFFHYASAAVYPYLDIDQSGAALLALSLGLPIIASDIGGLRDVVLDGKNGYLVAPGDADELAGRITGLFESTNENTVFNMALESRKLSVEKFSWNDIARKTVDVYATDSE